MGRHDFYSEATSLVKRYVLCPCSFHLRQDWRFQGNEAILLPRFTGATAALSRFHSIDLASTLQSLTPCCSQYHSPTACSCAFSFSSSNDTAYATVKSTLNTFSPFPKSSTAHASCSHAAPCPVLPISLL